MKIISKFKDYFDYLVGIYGEDPKIILDRTSAVTHYTPTNLCMVYVNLCGTVYIGLWNGNKVLYSIPEIKEFCSNNNEISIDADHLEKKTSFWLKFNKRYVHVPISLRAEVKTDVAYSILLSDRSWSSLKNENFTSYPILKDFNFASVCSAEEVWINISNWLGARNNETSILIQTDKQKVSNHGFDLKTSFRKEKGSK